MGMDFTVGLDRWVAGRDPGHQKGFPALAFPGAHPYIPRHYDIHSHGKHTIMIVNMGSIECRILVDRSLHQFTDFENVLPNKLKLMQETAR